MFHNALILAACKELFLEVSYFNVSFHESFHMIPLLLSTALAASLSQQCPRFNHSQSWDRPNTVFPTRTAAPGTAGKVDSPLPSSSVVVVCSWQRPVSRVSALFLFVEGFSKNLRYVLRSALLQGIAPSTPVSVFSSLLPKWFGGKNFVKIEPEERLTLFFSAKD